MLAIVRMPAAIMKPGYTSSICGNGQRSTGVGLQFHRSDRLASNID
jgi:hypothetical protein